MEAIAPESGLAFGLSAPVTELAPPERPLFSDRLEGRELTHKEINSGIEKFRTLITTRALNVEKLKKSFNKCELAK